MMVIIDSFFTGSLPSAVVTHGIRRRRTVKNSPAAALVNFGWRSSAPHFFRRREHVSGWRGGGIRRLTGLAGVSGMGSDGE